MDRVESKALGQRKGWTARKLTARDVAKLSSQEYEWHSHWNRLNLDAALQVATPAAVPSAYLAPQSQRDVATAVLSRYPAYVWSDRNANAINGWLKSLSAPKFTAAEVQQAFEECASAGQLELRLPDGRIVVGRELMNLTAEKFRGLITPNSSTEEIELKMSAAEYRAAHAADFDEGIPALILADRNRIAQTVKALPRFRALVLSHADVNFILQELKRNGVGISVQSLAAVIDENASRFEWDEDQAAVQGQVIRHQSAS